MARGRTKGASDKVPRKLRGGARKGAVTEGPIFASSNNRRGKDTAMQRSFAAHFTAPGAGHHEVPEPETVNPPPTRYLTFLRVISKKMARAFAEGVIISVEIGLERCGFNKFSEGKGKGKG
jgi:hypothetical protein